MASSMSLHRLSSARCTGAARPGHLARRQSVRAAASSTDVPPNVAEARAWIAAWRAKQQQQQPGAAAGNGAPAAAAAPAEPKTKPAAAPKAAKAGSKYGASASFADGTLVFTADQLKSVDYSDVKLKNKK